ncbi:hypothetical protein ACA910_003033 [Epithemia clementina (nom. ined.)]
MLRTVDTSTWLADNNFGEMFLNFWLHPELQKYAGIDLTSLFPEELPQDGSKRCLWEAWNRCAMGLSPSPYQATQSSQRIKVLAIGNRHDLSNVFRWDKTVMNLPGSTHFQPHKPWIFKVRRDGTIAVDVHPYVDDMRETAPTEESA